jgi:parvulin-like peptidyl-prolyl isomerase
MKTRVYLAIMIALLLIASCEVAETETGDSAVTEMKSSVVEPESATEVVKVEPVKEKPVVEPVEEKPVVEVSEVEPVKEIVAVEPKEPAVEPETVAEPVEDKVVVTVNGVKFMQSQVDEKLTKQVEAQISRMQASGREVPAEQMAKMRESMKKRFEQRIISMLIDEQLIKEKLAAKNIVISDDEVEAKITEISEQRKVSPEELLAGAAKQGISEADAKEQIRMTLGVEAVIQAELGDEAKVTDEDAKKQYDENTQRFSTPEQVRASHILIKTEGKDEAGKAAAKAKIEDILKQAREGADFAELAITHTEDLNSKKTGGEYTFPRGKMVPEFDKTAFSMEVDQISDPIETRFGYHIIKLHEKIAAKTTSFEEAKEGIKKNLANRKKGEFWRTFQQTLKDEATIEYAEGKEPPARPTRPTGPGAAPGRPARPPRPPKPPVPPTPTESNK